MTSNYSGKWTANGCAVASLPHLRCSGAPAPLISNVIRNKQKLFNCIGATVIGVSTVGYSSGVSQPFCSNGVFGRIYVDKVRYFKGRRILSVFSS